MTDTITNTRVDEIVDALNTYDGDNIWQDIIFGLPEFDEATTFDADPTCRNDVIVLTDGTFLAWRTDLGGWAFDRREDWA